VLALAARHGWLVSFTAGMLAALGIQTFFLFIAYTMGNTTYSTEVFGPSFGYSIGPGGPLGMTAGALLAVAGFLGVASARRGPGS
jgi:hypothetical protein